MALDAEILGVIEAWHRHGATLGDDAFNDLALRLFAYQLRYNEPYARYCEALGRTEPRSWEQIPAVPAAAFKEAALTTFDPMAAALVFETSGTTNGAGGLHYMETALLYDAALLAGFDRFVLAEGTRFRYFNLVPNPQEHPRSSLGYMMARVAERFGDGRAGFYVRDDELRIDAFTADVTTAIDQGRPVCIAATAFSLVALLDAMNVRDLTFALPRNSRVMQTGGFKGRSRVVDQDELGAAICDRFGVMRNDLVSEYGMTELSSQCYAIGTPAYAAPPWLRTRAVGPERITLPNGAIGALLHVDLANRSSCVAIQTEDLGIVTAAGLVLLGRDREAPLRGCSLGAEDLAKRETGRL
ncbi:MAG: acyl-protein synthetase [Candidatus Eremiobacteraeota bacterium]|nr:acyl-protein synthetase [Candidatus Eremiobacteraeota bacterium]